MSYVLTIQRTAAGGNPNPDPISLEEWKSAVERCPNLRFAMGAAHQLRSPILDEPIEIAHQEGDAEIFRSDLNEWHLAFLFSGDGISFTLIGPVPGYGQDEIWSAAWKLACGLGAAIVGEEGEHYDLPMGID